jgi:hypothetical protein
MEMTIMGHHSQPYDARSFEGYLIGLTQSHPAPRKTYLSKVGGNRNA